MKLQTAFLAATLIVLSACNNNPETVTNEKTDVKTSATNCYSYVTDKDTVMLKITSENGGVSGSLVYNFFEKDKNTGTVKGEMKGDLLLLDYTYMSEGMESVRPLVFKKTGENFVEGYGETEMKNGKDVFKSTDALTFSNSVLLKPGECGK